MQVFIGDVMPGKSFASGAIILMASGFIARLLGFVFRIYLSNRIGAEGMGLFQLISPLYTLIVLTLTSGISIAVSKMTAEEYAKHHPANLKRITACALYLVITAGVAASLALLLNIGFIAGDILKDERTYRALLLLVPCIPPVAAASALKGYFYGIQRVVPTAVSQIVEQLVKIGLVMLLAANFASFGLEYACAAATAAMALGEIANLAVLAVVYGFIGKGLSLARAGLMRKTAILKALFKTAVPVSANRFVISIMSAVEYILIPIMLAVGGLDARSSMEVYGRLSGMALPLIFFPSLVTSSLATTLVPAISEAVSLKNYRTVNYRISKSVQITFIMGIISTAIFMTYPNEIGNLIYRRERIGDLLYLLSFSCVFIYLQQTLTGVLNGLGRQGILLRNTIIGSLIRIGSVCFLIPAYGIKSYIWGLAASFLVTAFINLAGINRMTGLVIDLRNWVLKPGAVGIVMLLTGRYIYGFFEILTRNNGLKLLLSLAMDMLAALVLMVATGALKKEEIMKLL